MIIPYNVDSSSKNYTDYYAKQVGGELPYYSGSRMQKGYGIGGVFGKLFKGAQPMLSSAIKTAGKELLQTGINIARDALQGKNLKQSAKTNFKRSGANLLGKLSTAFENPKPLAKKRKATRPKTSKNKRIKRTLTKDIFA